METILREIRHSIRVLLKQRSFTAVALLTLTLGIGANTAIFSVVNGVLLRPLPFPHPEQLVIIQHNLKQVENIGLSVDELKDLQNRSGIFDEVSATWPVDANLTGSDRPERIELLAVSPNYFSLLGAKAERGRVFGPEDKAQGFAESAVISHGLWERLFGADPTILGRKVYVDNDPYTVVGVMPADFRHPGKTLRDAVDIWATAGFEAKPFPPPQRNLRFLPGSIGRLKPGLSIAQAQSQLDNFVSGVRAEFPNDYPPETGWNVRLLPAREALTGNVQTVLFVLLGAVALVLLIGCVNLANLLLARSSARKREMAIRLALGATRRRLISQLLIESLLLSVAGGVLGLVLVASLMKLILLFVPADVPRLNEVGINFGVLIFVLLVSVICGLAFGLVPALQSSRADLLSGLKEGSQGSGSGAAHNRFRAGLVVIEFALSLMLMIGAGLLFRSFTQLMEVNPGFNPQNVLLARIWLPVPNDPDKDPYRDPEKRAQFAREVLARASALPTVQSAAVGNGYGVPLIGPHPSFAWVVEDRPDRDAAALRSQGTSVSEEYFKTLKIPTTKGRTFATTDDAHALQVAVIDETFAQRFFPGEDPIGRHLKPTPRESKAPWITIVGVVGNVKTDGFDQSDQPHIYRPLAQNPGYALAVYLRTNGNPVALAPMLRKEVQSVDRNLPVFGEQSMTDLVATSLAQRRFAAELVGLFGLTALLLAGIGIYGVMSYSVSQRTREIGIRLALGASRGRILGWIVKQGMWLSLIGVSVGTVAAIAFSRVLHGLLFGVAPTDVITYVSVGILLSFVALLACYIPARRATKVDPIKVLKYE
jgi:predicted permease